MSDIIDDLGNSVTVVATLPDGGKIEITTKERLDSFFLTNHNAKLEFVRSKEGIEDEIRKKYE